MNDEETLAALRSSLAGVKESLTDVHLDRSADAIRARARGRVVRRGLAGAGAAGVALGVSLALAAGGGGPAATARSVHVNLDAWSVNTLPGGLVYVDVRALVEPALLRQTLAQAGVPAIVTFGEFCTGTPGGDNGNLQPILGKAALGGEPKLTIRPAAIPAGSELSIGIVSVPPKGSGGNATVSGPGLDTSFGLVKEGSRLSCGQPPVTSGSDGKKGPGTPGGTGPGATKPAASGVPGGTGPGITKPAS
jgi:hypothetical protein